MASKLIYIRWIRTGFNHSEKSLWHRITDNFPNHNFNTSFNLPLDTTKKIITLFITFIKKIHNNASTINRIQ